MSAFAYLKYSDSLVTSATVQAKDPGGAHTDYTVDANFPLANLKTIPVQRPTKITIPVSSVTEINIQMDFGAATNFNVVAIAGHNLSSTATIKLYADTTIYPTTLIGTMVWTHGTAFYKFATTKNYRYLAIEIDDANSDYTYVSVGLIMVGMLTTTTLTINEGWKFSTEAVNVQNDGEYITPISRNLYTRKRAVLPFENVLESAFAGMVTLYEDLKENTAPALILPDASDHYGFVGRFQEELERSYPHSINGTGAADDLVSISIPFIEDANPILL